MEQVVYPVIKRAKYLNAGKTKIQVVLENENGTSNVAEFQIEKDAPEGTNELWDRIKKEYDMSLMDKELDAAIRKAETQRAYEDKKKRAAMESARMKTLFDAKLNFFNFPLIEEFTDEEKATIRRAPDMMMLNIAITWAVMNYATRTGKSMLDVFDALEDSMYRKTLDENKKQ